MLAIIGGTGLYKLDGVNILESKVVETPFGMPSGPITFAQYKGYNIVFLPRHGDSHQFLPHEVNYRANIFALKQVGVTAVIGVSAVGSLQARLKPGELCLVGDYFDRVMGLREKTFFGNGIAAHIASAKAVSKQLMGQLYKAGSKHNINIHQNVTYGCVDGPRLGTVAESHYLRDSVKCDVVGMTNIPEAFLAKEAQISYCTLGVITDYDSWKTDESHHVTVEDVLATYGRALEGAKSVIFEYIKQDLYAELNQESRKHLKSAVITPLDTLNCQQKRIIDVLMS